MSQPDHIIGLNIDLPERDQLPEKTQKYFAICEEKLGLVPNVLAAYSSNIEMLNGFSHFYNALMLGDSGLSKLEREMIAVVVSAENHCVYCLAAHGATVRQYSGDPILGEMLVMNYRSADLSPRHRAMLDFTVKITNEAHTIVEVDREVLREVGFSDQDIWDIANVAGFYNMSNRVASAVDMLPNREYHGMAR